MPTWSSIWYVANPPWVGGGGGEGGAAPRGWGRVWGGGGGSPRGGGEGGGGPPPGGGGGGGKEGQPRWVVWRDQSGSNASIIVAAYKSLQKCISLLWTAVRTD